jgi:hypothetical protein
MHCSSAFQEFSIFASERIVMKVLSIIIQYNALAISEIAKEIKFFAVNYLFIFTDSTEFDHVYC